MSNKRKIKKVIIKRHSFEGGIDEVLGRLKQFAGEWKQNLEDHGKRVAEQVNTTFKQIATEFARVYNVINQQGSVLEMHDNNILVIAKMQREIYGHVSQIDALLGKLGSKELEKDEIEALKATADEWYQDSMKNAFAEVHAEKAQETQQKEEARAKAQAYAEQAKTDADWTTKLDEAYKKLGPSEAMTDAFACQILACTADEFEAYQAREVEREKLTKIMEEQMDLQKQTMEEQEAKAKTDADEKQRMDTELAAAETAPRSDLNPIAGGPGVPVPEGAEVFGGG